MNQHAQRRAKKGGELGVNGEWYEGGKWIANTESEKRFGSKKPTGKRQIGPFAWAIPADGMRSIYEKWSGTWGISGNGEMRCRDLPVAYWGIEYLKESQEMADKWNAGERWMP